MPSRFKSGTSTYNETSFVTFSDNNLFLVSLWMNLYIDQTFSLAAWEVGTDRSLFDSKYNDGKSVLPSICHHNDPRGQCQRSHVDLQINGEWNNPRPYSGFSSRSLVDGGAQSHASASVVLNLDTNPIQKAMLAAYNSNTSIYDNHNTSNLKRYVFSELDLLPLKSLRAGQNKGKYKTFFQGEHLQKLQIRYVSFDSSFIIIIPLAHLYLHLGVRVCTRCARYKLINIVKCCEEFFTKLWSFDACWKRWL